MRAVLRCCGFERWISCQVVKKLKVFPLPPVARNPSQVDSSETVPSLSEVLKAVQAVNGV